MPAPEPPTPPTPPPALAPYVGRAAVRRLLTLHAAALPDANFGGLPPEELDLYFTLTRRVESPQTTAQQAAKAPAFREPDMVRIPTSQFRMGIEFEEAKRLEEELKELRYDPRRETPAHRVNLPEYSVGKYPVTNAEYQAFVRDKARTPPRGWDGDRYPEGKGDHPVVGVNWFDAQAYCQWLSEKTGKPYRLPTEAEWENAARGAERRRYPWGNDWDASHLNSRPSGVGDTTAVGRYSPAGDSAYGCADMAGNVWEWCADWFDEHTYERRAGSQVTDPRGPETGIRRVARGGSFTSDPLLTRTTTRFAHPPDHVSLDCGFRVAMSASAERYPSAS